MLKNIVCILITPLLLFISCKKRRDEPSPTYKSIYGKVITNDSDSTKVVESAELSLNGVTKTSDSNGFFQFEKITFGEHSLIVRHDEYQTRSMTLNVSSTSDSGREIVLTKKVIQTHFINEDMVDFGFFLDTLNFSIENGHNTLNLSLIHI